MMEPGHDRAPCRQRRLSSNPQPGFRELPWRHRLSRQLRYALRTDDVVCRLGGDEFLIICPATPLDGALQIAEATRQQIADMHVAVGDGGEWAGSISVGVAVRTADMQTPEDLIKAADEGVYLSKRKGRNRVEQGNLLPVAQ